MVTDKLLELLNAAESLKDSIREICESPAPSDCGEHRRVLRTKLDQLKRQEGWTPQARGYELERLVLALAAVEGMSPSPSYRPPGEQVDGLIDLDGRYFLLETKWQKDPVRAADIYGFLGKVLSKFDGTCGIFMAMGKQDELQFAADAKTALVYGKALNIILCSADDIEWAFGNQGGIRRLIRTKLRYASQRGEVHYPVSRWDDEATTP